MKRFTKPLFTGQGAARFLRETVVGSLESVLFVSISVLFTLAGTAAFLEDSTHGVGISGTPASIAAAAAPRLPGQAATVQTAHLAPRR